MPQTIEHRDVEIPRRTSPNNIIKPEELFGGISAPKRSPAGK
jgi:hypothetical protein